jgi:hypothetical protein
MTLRKGKEIKKEMVCSLRLFSPRTKTYISASGFEFVGKRIRNMKDLSAEAS